MPDKEDIASAIKQVFRDPSVAKNVIHAAAGTRPKTWSDRSNATYYKECYAIEIRGYIDKMIEARAAGDEECCLRFDYDVFCGEKKHGQRTIMSENTLYLKINSAIRYLVERMDTEDRRYGQWRDRTVCDKREELNGIVYKFASGSRSNPSIAPTDYGPELVKEPVMKQEWEKRLDFWLQSSNQKPFVEENVRLSIPEIEALELKLAQLPNILRDITPRSIKLIKMT